MGPTLESVTRARRMLILSAFMTVSMSLVGITLVAGAGAVLMVRAYVAVGERMADMSGPGVEESTEGMLSLVKELAAGPGIHRPMFWSGCALTVLGIVLTIAHVWVWASIKRKTAHEMGRIAADLRAERERRGSTRGG